MTYESRIVLPLWLTPTGAGGYYWDAEAFIPTMVTLLAVDALPQAEAVPLATQWQSLDIVRHVLSLLAFLAALKALSVAEPRADTPPAGLGSARARG